MGSGETAWPLFLGLPWRVRLYWGTHEPRAWMSHWQLESTVSLATPRLCRPHHPALGFSENEVTCSALVLVSGLS